MVVANRQKKVYYPLASRRIEGIQDSILQILMDNEISDRIIFPITSELSTFDCYDDIKKEYLVDFSTSNDDIIVFNPEYFTVIKKHNDTYLHDIKDQIFYYIQQTLSYTSVERKYIKEDLVLGFCHLNPSNVVDDWGKLARVFNKIAKELHEMPSIEFLNNGTIECSMDGVLVGFGKNRGSDGIMEAHFSLTDIYTVLNKRK